VTQSAGPETKPQYLKKKKKEKRKEIYFIPLATETRVSAHEPNISECCRLDLDC
jgi:hypothetical protein